MIQVCITYSQQHTKFTNFLTPILTRSKRCFFEHTKVFDKFDMMVFFDIKLLGICGRYCILTQLFLNNRHRRVVLNGQSSKWSLVEADVPKGSILSTLFFLVYINDLPQGLRCDIKLFATSDTSLFSTITSPVISNLNEDLLKTIEYAYQWKMLNPNIIKQTQEMFLSRDNR